MGSGVGRNEYSLVGWGWGQGGDRGGSSLESPGAVPPGSPSWRPGLGRDRGVRGPRPGLTHLGLSPSSPWRSEMETSLAPRPRSPGQEWPLGVCAPSVRYGPSDSGSLTCALSPLCRGPTTQFPHFSPRGLLIPPFWIWGAVLEPASVLISHIPKAR